MTSPGPWHSSERDPAVARLLDRDAASSPPEPALLREPVRAFVAAGALLAVVASPLAWATETGVPRPDVRTGWTGTADGFLLAAVGGALALLALNRGVAESRTRTLRLLPLVLGLAAGALGVGAIRNVDHQIRLWEGGGGSGVYEPGLFVALVGAAMLAVGGVLLGLGGLRRFASPDPPGSGAPAIDRPTLYAAGSGTVGTLAGAAFAAFAVLRADLPPAAIGLPLLFGVLVGAIVGGFAGARFGRFLAGG